MTRPPASRWSSVWLRVMLVVIGGALLVPAWAGVRMIQAGSVVSGIGLTAVALITIALYVRAVLRVVVSSEPSDDPTGFLWSERYVDYVIWTAVGIPFVIVALIVVWLITKA
jgi:hypothetical protein